MSTVSAAHGYRGQSWSALTKQKGSPGERAALGKALVHGSGNAVFLLLVGKVWGRKQNLDLAVILTSYRSRDPDFL